MKLIFKAYKKNNEIILTGYYEKKSKEKLSKKPCERHQNLHEEGKKKRLYFREQYRNPSEEEIKKKGQYGRE